jgi:hypothetical protein
MMAVIGDPELRLMIERFAGGPPQYGPFAAIRDEFGVWAETTREGTTEFTPVEPSLLPWAVARAVGHGPRATPGFEGTLELRASALQLTLDRLAELDVESASGSSSWLPTSTSSSASCSARSSFSDGSRGGRSRRAESRWSGRSR